MRLKIWVPFAFMAASVAVPSTWAQGSVDSFWTCLPDTRYVCGAEGCAAAPALVSVVIDLAANTYARCDAQGCDTYKIEGAVQAGAFSHLLVMPGLIFKAANDGSAYTEIATLGLVSHVNHGRCERASGPVSAGNN